MKIPKSLRDIHADRAEIFECLREQVDRVIHALKDSRWHYESRLKDVESFALKVETGRYEDPSQLEDFFACTLVVENLAAMADAEKMIRKRFTFQERRPKNLRFTTKASDSFRFDDTRLYVKWKDDSLARPSGLNGLLFEVQIKTFLAHAWSIATHDLIYKTDEKSWPKERIAFQIKAMLEHAETSIQEAKKLSKSVSLKRTDDISQRISAIIVLVNDLWPAVSLPRDRKRLAENIDALIRNVGVSMQELKDILMTEMDLGRGPKTLNLSPYSIVVQSLLNQKTRDMIGYLTGGSRKFRIYIPIELNLPDGLDLNKLNNAVIVSDV